MTDPKEKAVHFIGEPLPPITDGLELFARCPQGHLDYRADIERGDCSACKRERLDKEYPR